MIGEGIESKVLGQLLLMQSVINNLPDKESIYSFVSNGLKDIPGVKSVLIIQEKIETIRTNSIEVNFPIALGDSYFGNLRFFLLDSKRFKPYENYILNFVFMLGVVLEERQQRDIINENKISLERRIQERTHQLNFEKENLAESQRRFNDLMSNIKLLSVMLNDKGEIIFLNKHLLEQTGYEEEELIGQNWFDVFLDSNIKDEVKLVFDGVMKDDDFSHFYENEIYSKTGEKLLIAWNNTLLRDTDKNVIGTASIGENITQRKRNELLLEEQSNEIKKQNVELNRSNKELEIAKQKAEESNMLKTAFLQNLSHEIRTPMNAIMGFSDLLDSCFGDRDKLKYFSNIIKSRSKDLLEIINDILDIAKIESGQLPINAEEFKLSELFNELSIFFKEYKKRSKKDKVKLYQNKSFLFDENIIVADKLKLKQIFINLINNAIKFTNDGKVEFGYDLDQNGELIFYVSDTGIGIPADKQSFIFERFAQVHSDNANTFGGTGLGLPIVKGLVELMGGKIWLKSSLANGSVFSFSLPVKIKNGNLDIPEQIVKRQNGAFAGKKILIVEDDFFNREYLKEVLTGCDAIILEAVNGKEAVKVAETELIDLILMDLRLPLMDGYEATRQILQEKPSMKIVAQTAYASNDDKLKAIEIGCVDYLSKPTKKENLYSVLNKCLAS